MGNIIKTDGGELAAFTSRQRWRSYGTETF